MASVFFKGIRIFPKKASQPKFVVASGVVSLNELAQFVKEQKQSGENITDYKGEPQIKFQITQKDDGSMSMQVDTYKGGTNQPSNNANSSSPISGMADESKRNPNDVDDLPF